MQYYNNVTDESKGIRGPLPPKTSDEIFVLQKKQILGQTDQMQKHAVS